MFKYVDFLKKNAKIAGVDKHINFSRVELEWLDIKFKKESIDRIITNPPISKNANLDKVYNEFFSDKTAHLFGRTFPVILAQNFIAHTNNPHSFVEGCKMIMDSESVLYLQTSQCNMFFRNEFDTIYHEHSSFFSEKSMNTLVEAHGMVVEKIEKTNIHGDSFLFTVKLKNKFYKGSNTFEPLPFDRYKENVYRNIEEIRKTVIDYRNQGYKIIGYGASAKGNTLLNYAKIKLDYILDDQKSKWNMYTPGMNIEIKNPEYIQNEKGNIIILALTWNFIDEISRKLRFLTRDNNNLEIYILKYFPKIEFTKLDKHTKLTIISHFYNEEYLLPFWLEHHKNIFDHGILIDYESTDDSVSIIKKIVPHWTVVPSKNVFFDAADCDKEVIEYERLISTGYKISLNITEFISSNIKETLHNKEYPSILQIRCIPMFDKKEDRYTDVEPNIPLFLQRYHGDIDSVARSHRFIHRMSNLPYNTGRHRLRKNLLIPLTEIPISESVILWYGGSPYNEKIIARYLQKTPKYSERDRAVHYCVPMYTEQDILTFLESLTDKPEPTDLRNSVIGYIFKDPF